MPDPTKIPAVLTDAIAVVTAPERYADRADLRLLAWQALKSGRSQRVSMVGLHRERSRLKGLGAAHV